MVFYAKIVAHTRLSMGNKKRSKKDDSASALLTSPWRNPGYPRDPSSIEGLFSGLPNRDIEKLFQIMQVLARKAEERIGELETMSQPNEPDQYPYGLWFNLPLHVFPESVSKEDIKYVLGMLHEYFGVLKSLTYYGDYEFAVKFNVKANDFLFLKHLVDTKYQATTTIKTEYDQEKKLLKIQGVEILIAKKQANNPHRLLSTLFKEPMKEWSYDEIEGDWDPNSEKIVAKIKQKNYYLTSRETNRKIAEKTTISDFLIPSNTSVKINRKYL